MDETSRSHERELLRQSWDRVSSQTLDVYLVSGVEDPRVNVQSILNRSLLCDLLMPGRFTRLLEDELRFGFVMTWLIPLLQRGVDRETLCSALLAEDRDRCPQFVLETACILQRPSCGCPDYLAAAISDSDRTDSTRVSTEVLDTFLHIWRRELAECPATGVEVFEPACGSANDYRYLASYGFDRLIQYTGMDIATKNIANARRRFPKITFRTGDVLDTDMADDQFDICFVHDLLEHLPLAGIDRALQEVMRVTRREAWIHCFNAGDCSAHMVQPVGAYQWNLLSVQQLVRMLRQFAAHVDVVSMAELARAKFGFGQYYNPGAYTIIAAKC